MNKVQALDDKPIKVNLLIFFAAQLLLGVILFVAVTVTLSFDWEEFQGIHSGPIFLGFLLTGVIALSIGLRWQIVLKKVLGSEILTGIEASAYFLVGRLFGLAIPKDISDLTSRAYLLVRRHEVSLQKAVLSVAIDRFWDVWVAGILIIPSMLFFLFGVPEKQIALLVPLLILFGIFFPRLIPDKAFLVLGLLYETLRPKLSKVPLVSSWPLVSPLPKSSSPTWTKIVILSFVKITATMARAYTLSLAVDLPITFFFFLLATPIVQLSFVLALTPDGLGITDATWAGLLLTQGISSAQIASYVVIRRVFITIFIVLLGLWSLISLRRNRIK